ncbi:MAG TPA: hypothetical protein DDW85_03125, partial [Porphyromonadaceae bacterium]|nr:hypothetical protein [Porphyromonadaceae bacterium]
SDMCLKWDLYVNGIISEKIASDIEEELRCFFDDSASFLDFLKWLKCYNSTTRSKVHIFGFNTLAQPQLFFFDYFRLLLGDINSLPYLRLLKKENYRGIIDHALTDARLQSIMEPEDFNYLLFLLNESIEGRTIFNGENENREFDMWKRADKIIQQYLKKDNKVVIYAHSSHINKKNDFFFDVQKKPSLGNYIHKKYGNGYFSICFQVGRGKYTQDDSGVFSKTVIDTLQAPMITSFEFSALVADNSYFYYPAQKLSDDISSVRAIGRERKNTNQFFFCSIKKRFNGVVFIRNSNQLNRIEKYPFFYTNGFMQNKKVQQQKILKEL